MLNRFKTNSVARKDEIRASGFPANLSKIKRIVTLGLLTLILPACAVNSRAISVNGTPVSSGSTLGNVADKTDEFLGEIVTMDGKVGHIINSDTFIIVQGNILTGNEVLVVNSNPKVPIVRGNWVRVTGEVRPFVSREIQRDYNLTWDLDVTRQLEVEYEQQPAIVAESVELLAMD